MTNRRNLFIIMLAIMVGISLIYIFNYNKRNQETVQVNVQTPAPISIIIPGKTTKSEVLQELGTPISSQSGILQYKSTSPARNNEITIQSNTVSFVKEIVSFKDTTTVKDLELKYGISSYLYGPDSVNGYYLFYQPDQGVAYIANPNTGTVLEIWHFPITTVDSFISTYAKDYSKAPIKGQF